MNRIWSLWRTTTVRLTAMFILIFVVAAVVLLALMAYQSSIVIQRQQITDIEREIGQIERLERRQGLRSVAASVQRLSDRPGPGIYYLGDDVGRMLVGNVPDLPARVLATDGVHTFDYAREQAFEDDEVDDPRRPPNARHNGGYALVKSVQLESGLRLVVGRDILERRGFAAIIFQGFFVGVIGIIILSVVTGGLTAMRVLRRIDAISDTSAKIMTGSMSERIPVTKRDDEFDRLARNLNDMLDRIEQLMQGLKEVTDNVAHDLKTPLTRLRNKSEAALRDGDDPVELRAALETTIAESDQLIRTFNALLLIARVEAGAPSSAFSDVDLSAVVADVAELYEPVAEDAGMTLNVDVQEGVHMRANRELIGQVLVNLVENAIKYGTSNKDDARIDLTIKTHQDRVHIEVADHGPGIPEEDRAHAVERFVRLEKSRTEKGSGLGLSLVAAVARLHKGELRIEDNNPGLRAIIDLPNNL